MSVLDLVTSAAAAAALISANPAETPQPQSSCMLPATAALISTPERIQITGKLTRSQLTCVLEWAAPRHVDIDVSYE